MRFTPLLTLALLAAWPPARAQSRGRPALSAQSEWKASYDKDGEVSHTLVNRTFALGVLRTPAQTMDLLFTQEIRSTSSREVEGPQAKTIIETWARMPLDTIFARRLWRAEVAADEARPLDNYYELLTYGCCGSQFTRTWLSLGTGRTVMSFTGDVVNLMSDTGTPMTYVSFLHSRGMETIPELADSAQAAGVLQLTRGDRLVSRMHVFSTQDDMVDGETPDLSLISSDGREERAVLSLGAGQTVSVRLRFMNGVSVLVPVRAGAFAIQGALIPAGVRLRPIP